MNCPKCGSVAYDNVAENAERAARGEKLRPNYKCKSTTCDWVAWPPKNGNGAAPAAPAPAKPAPTQKQGYTAGASLPGEHDPITTLYLKCFDVVMTECVPRMVAADIGATPESVHAMVSTLFIGARQQ